jgi:hypothetical protein
MASKPAVAPVIKCDELNRSADRASKNLIQRLRYGDSIDMGTPSASEEKPLHFEKHWATSTA